MTSENLRAARANRVFWTDEKHIRPENTVTVKSECSVGFYTRSAIRADGFSSAQSRDSVNYGGAIEVASYRMQSKQGG